MRRNAKKTTLRPGQFYEDCGYHPCLCIAVEEDGEVRGISLVDGNVRACDLHHCGVKRLSFDEALAWRFEGPRDLPTNVKLEAKQRWWEAYGSHAWIPDRPPPPWPRQTAKTKTKRKK